MNTSSYNFSTLRSLSAGLILAGAATAGALADVVTDWNATLEAALRNPTPSVPAQARASAIVHVAIFDTVNGITRKYTPLRVFDSPPLDARPDAAAAYAAHTTLVSLFPAKQSLFDGQLATSLAQIPAGALSAGSLAASKAWGERVARDILAWRANDGFSQSMAYPGNNNVGHWRHGAMGNAPAGAISTSVTAPFALRNLPSFDPGPPYGAADRAAALASAAYAADVNEVKERGGLTSPGRTQAQADLALLIHISDVADINAIVRRVLPSSFRLDDSARTFALLNIAASDAAVVCFQAKYKYGFWRPLQAIPNADVDGNPATTADPQWKPLGATPSHPEYISGHSTVAGGMLVMASALLGDEHRFTVSTSNAGAPAIAPEFSRFSTFLDAIVESRIDMGFHFRTACRLGQRAGTAVANQIVRHALLPAPGGGVINLAVRGRVGSGEETLIAGFNITAGVRQTLIRAVGPSLLPLGVSGALADPRIALFDPAGRLVAENDNWSAGGSGETSMLVAAGEKSGAFALPVGSRDAAMLATLLPGAYTIHASGVAGASGVTLIEVFEVP